MWCLVFCILIWIFQSGLACNEAAVPLDRMNTRGVNYTATTSGMDNYLQERWYSTLSNGLQYLIADINHKPVAKRCGTRYPLHLQGVHPSLNCITDKPIDVTACVQAFYSDCIDQYSLKIRKCNGEIQYYLLPVNQKTFISGYCFDPWSRILPGSTGECPTTTTTTPRTTTTEKVDVLGVTAELKFKTDGRPTEHQDITPYILFRCDFSKASGRLYAVSWFVDGVLLLTTGPSVNETTFLLHEDTLLRHVSGSQLHGKQLSCGVSLYSLYDSNTIVSTVQSKSMKIAAEVKTNPVTLPKNGIASLKIEFTLPIGCGYSIIRNEKPRFPCEYSLKLYMKDGWKCAAGGVANIVKNHRDNFFCTEPIKLMETPSQWNRTFQHSLDIATIDHNYEDKRTFYLQLKFDDSIAHKFWKNYTFPDIKVIVDSRNLYKNKVCYSHYDPHMKTADNSHYEQQKTGYFMLYYNLKYKIEVQIQVAACGSTIFPATCVCGMAVRAGRDVFMINLSGGVNFLGFLSCGDGGIIDVIEMNTRYYWIGS